MPNSTGKLASDTKLDHIQTGFTPSWRLGSKIKIKTRAKKIWQYAGNGSGEGGLYLPEVTDILKVKEEIQYAKPAFGEALLDMYLGSGDLVPDAKAKWAHAAKDLLESITQQ